MNTVETGNNSKPFSRIQHFLPLLVSLLLSYSAAGVGGMASVNAEEFYSLLIRPNWSPPPSVFGPVWSVLYTLIAISACLVWLKKQFSVRLPYLIFAAQLLANALWSWIFFYWQLGLIAILEIALLCILIAFNAASFYRISKTAGLLLLPYLCWVSFATLLATVLWLNNASLL